MHARTLQSGGAQRMLAWPNLSSLQIMVREVWFREQGEGSWGWGAVMGGEEVRQLFLGLISTSELRHQKQTETDILEKDGVIRTCGRDPVAQGYADPWT